MAKRKSPGAGEVFIRPPSPSDREEWCALWDASWPFLKPWMPRPESREAGLAGTRFDTILRTADTPTDQKHMVCRAGDGRIVGVVNLGQIFMGPFRSCHMGYWVGAVYAGQGYTSAGVRLVLARAFGPLGLHRVEANIMPHNAASLALARHVGFREEGFSPRYLKIAGKWQDHARFAMTAEDWRELRKESRAKPGRVSRSTRARSRAST